MTENTAGQETSRSFKFQRRLSLLAAFLCFAASAVVFALGFVLFIEDCPGCRSYLAGTLGSLALVLFIAGLLIISTILCRKGGQNTLTPQVAISVIPVEDLEKSPATFQFYNHVPHYQPFVETPSIDLPDYFTAVQNIDEVHSSVDAKFWARDVPETPPPCYKQALEMLSDVTAHDMDTKEIPKIPDCYDSRNPLLGSRDAV